VNHAHTERFVSRLTRNTLALVLAGGRGTRLRDLTNWRAKPAVPFGGKFRIIDFPLSNCINSGIRRMSVLTQYKAHSLIQHIQKGWGFLRGEFNEFVELWPAQQRVDPPSWYIGTADAVYQNIDIIRDHDPDFVLVLAGDHVYKMDYGPLLARHVERNADITVGCIEVPVAEGSDFGIMTMDDDGKVVEFQEKPKHPKPMPGHDDTALASMGIYVFNTPFLIERLERDAGTLNSSRDFAKDVIPAAIQDARVFAYRFVDPSNGRRAYWRDVGTVDAFWLANLELADAVPELNLYDDEWPIWTYQEQRPPAKFIYDEEDRLGMAVNSMVSGGVIVCGAVVRHSLLFSSVRVDSHASVTDSVVLPDVTIGRSCRVRRAVIDQGCRLPEGTIVGESVEDDAKRFFVTPKGVVLVTPEMLGQQALHAG
jgi:glucose-1-phosphate adenylyltransferase